LGNSLQRAPLAGTTNGGSAGLKIAFDSRLCGQQPSVRKRI